MLRASLVAMGLVLATMVAAAPLSAAEPGATPTPSPASPSADVDSCSTGVAGVCEFICQAGEAIYVVVAAGFNTGVATCGGSTAICLATYAPCSQRGIPEIALASTVGVCVGIQTECSSRVA